MKALMNWDLYEKILDCVTDKELRDKCFKNVVTLYKQDCSWIAGEMDDASKKYGEAHEKYLQSLAKMFEEV